VKGLNKMQNNSKKRNQGNKSTNVGKPKIPLPPKTWQRQPRQPVNIQKLLGGKGQNINAPSNDLESLRQAMTVQTMTSVLPIECTVPIKAIENLSLGIVLHALKHGLSAGTRGPDTNPYNMYCYLTEVFVGAMQGTVPKLQQAPCWFWELIYAIKKKESKFKLSSVSYSWLVPDLITDVSPIVMGVGAQAYSVCLSASLLPGNVLSFPLIDTNPAYTTAIGEKAITNLWAYCRGTEKMTVLIGDPGESAYMDKDSSSFAVVYPELGDSYQTSGALKNTIYSERQIDSPLLAKFATYQPSGTAVWRGWQKAGASAGSTALIGPTLACMSSIEEIRAKNSPIIKFYNFDEFYEVLAITLATAAGADLHNQGTPITFCPLAPIEVQILLRQTMIPLFSNEKCQDLRVTDDNSELFLPFSVGQNGVSMGTNMLLPTFLAENIRAAKSFSNCLQPKNPRSIIHVLSVLGRPARKANLENYTVAGQPFPYIFSVFSNNQVLNLVDCSSAQLNSTVYVDLSREQIKVLETSWNKWIQTLATNLSPLVVVGQTDGVSLLKTGTLTNFQGQGAPIVPIPPNAIMAENKRLVKKDSSHHVVNIPGLARKDLGVPIPVPGTGYFDSLTDRFTTSLQIVSAPAWKHLSLWILPITLANPASLEEQSIQGWSAFYSESYRIPRSTAGGLGSVNPNIEQRNPSVYDRHASMAMIDTKAIAQDGQVELIADLLEMSKQGRGGFFDTIAALAGPVIKAISSF